MGGRAFVAKLLAGVAAFGGNNTTGGSGKRW